MKKLPLLSMFLLALSIIITITSCEKDEIDKLPSKTMSGRNTFGCLINGKAFQPNKPDFRYDYAVGSHIPDDYFEFIVLNDEITFNIVIFNSSIGINDSLLIHYDGAISVSTNIFICGEQLYLDPNDNNFVEIFYWDTENRIVAGTFDLTFYSENCEKKIIRVTDGRFDIAYSY